MEMKNKDYGRVGVLMGGPSSEREISLKSGTAVFKALSELGLDAVAIDITSADSRATESLIASQKIDCAFVALHGCFGEDGQIQRLLEGMRIPYTGSGPAASRTALDKDSSRTVFIEHGLPVPDCVICRRGRDLPFQSILSLGFPVVVKPATQGSSIGLSIIDNKEELQPALSAAFEYDEKVLAEKYVKGRELTVSVLQEKALPVIEIIPKRRFFDFEAKYQQGLTEYILPARLDPGVARRCQDLAVACHRALGCRGCSRTDMIMDASGAIFLLETNTIPGLTATSLLPKAAKLEGMDFPRLCLRLLDSAYEKK
jgi:D-alanine-D-alanine ligase